MNENKDINNLHNEEIEADQSLSPKVNRELSSSALKVIIDTHSTAVLNTIAKTYDPTNIAHALEGLSAGYSFPLVSVHGSQLLRQ